MRFLRQFIGYLAQLLLLAVPAHGASWEQTDGRYFEQGDLKAVRELLSREQYSGDRLLEAFQTAAWSGNVDLVKYLDQRGWGNVCRKSRGCDPVNYALLSRKHPKMVGYLLSRGFPPTREALLSASSQVTPDLESVSGGMEAVKLLCEQGADPLATRKGEGTSTSRNAPTVLAELEQRTADSHMDLGMPLRAARGEAAEVQVAEFFARGMCKKGAKVSKVFDDFLGIIHLIASKTADEKLLAFLNEKKFRPQVETYLLYEAIASSNHELLRHLKTRGWMSRCRQSASCRPFDVAAESGSDTEVLAFLETEGFELDGRNTSGSTPLMYATLNARVDAVKFLCEHGADYRKRVKLEVYDRSIMSIVRRAYGDEWCSSVISGKYSESTKEKARERCEWEGVLGVQISVSIPECVPGATCLGVPFPPKAADYDVGKLKALTEIFHYFKDGRCKPAQNELGCTTDVAKKAVAIGKAVNLRATPSVSGEMIEALPFGTVLDVLDSSGSCEFVSERVGRWIRVKVSDAYSGYLGFSPALNEGWVYDAYVDYFPSFEP